MRHIAAYRDSDTGRISGIRDLLDCLQHRRVVRAVELRHFFIGPVDGEDILDKIVRPDGKKIDPLRQLVDDGKSRGKLNHNAEER